MDGSSGVGEEGVMNHSGQIGALWRAAKDLNRAAAEVSRLRGRAWPGLPPLFFFTDPVRTPEPWKTAARLPPGCGVGYRALRAAGASGVRAPARAAGRAAGLAAARPGWRIPAAAHSVAAVESPGAVDARFVSPVFPAGGASAARPALGVAALAAAAAAAPCPV